MKQLLSIGKIMTVLLFIIGGLYSLNATTANAAKHPFYYQFVEDSDSSFNNIDHINKMEIVFDKAIDNPTGPPNYQNKIIVKNSEGTEINIIDRNNIVRGNSETGTNDKLTIEFKDLEFVDYITNQDLTLVIPKNSVYFDQIEDYELPFKVYDILPGFKSTFIDSKPDVINTNIFKYNSNYDIFIHVPKIFITKIETIHRYDGIDGINPDLNGDGVIDANDKIDHNGHEDPSLTNVDVFAEPDVDRLKVTLNDTDNDEFSRDLQRHSEVDGFSFGQAGLTPHEKDDYLGADEINLNAFDVNGRFLENRDFKLKLRNDEESEYDEKNLIIDNYIGEIPSGVFGETFPMIELMKDKELLESIVSKIPVGQLDKLGITYNVQKDTVENVTTINQLNLAIKNPNIRIINLDGNITVGTLTVERDDVTIVGNGNEITGDIILGNGTENILVELQDLTLTGNLTVNVGAEGTAIISNDVNVNGDTTIQSGGVNSVYLNMFETNSLLINNTSPVRVVVDSLVIDDGVPGTTSDSIIITGTGNVTLEGDFANEEVYVESDSKITINVTERTTGLNLQCPKNALTVSGISAISKPSLPSGCDAEKLVWDVYPFDETDENIIVIKGTYDGTSIFDIDTTDPTEKSITANLATLGLLNIKDQNGNTLFGPDTIPIWKYKSNSFIDEAKINVSIVGDTITIHSLDEEFPTLSPTESAIILLGKVNASETVYEVTIPISYTN